MKVILITIISIIFLSSCCNNTIKKETQIKYDTIIHTQYKIDTFNVPGKITYLRDTLIVTKPFEVRFDTIIKNKFKHDTIHLKYNFPDNTFDYSKRSGIDTLIETSSTITNNETIIQLPTFWERIQNVLLYFVTGFLIGGFFVWLLQKY